MSKQVVAALIRKNGKLLACQRTEHQAFPLKWEFPGGKIEPGEDAPQALVRELEEELGIHARIGELVTRIEHRYKKGSTVDLHFFVVDDYDGEIDNRIFREVRWTTPADLPELDFLDADKELVRDIASGKIAGV